MTAHGKPRAADAAGAAAAGRGEDAKVIPLRGHAKPAQVRADATPAVDAPAVRAAGHAVADETAAAGGTRRGPRPVPGERAKPGRAARPGQGAKPEEAVPPGDAAEAEAPAPGAAAAGGGEPAAAPGEGGWPQPPEGGQASVGELLGGLADRLLGAPWERKVAGGLAFLRRRLTGEYRVDEFGYDADLTDQFLMPLVRPLYDRYFRVEVKGIEHIPSEGGALVVSNHSGTLPLDAVMTQVAVHDHHPAGRHLRLLAADLVFMLPVINELARKAGHTLACSEDAQLLLERGEVVGVMPEGFKGLGKPYSERYRLQRFGRGGFVATALRTGTPIVPCSIVGAEEIYPMVGNARTLARLLGLPYFPLTPTFPWFGAAGMLPLPTKWTIEFGEPIPTDGYPPEAADDPMLVFNLTDQVRETIQHTLYKLLVQRRSVFF